VGVNRSATPWVVVIVHCPWYNTQKNHYQEWHTIEMQENLEPVLMAHGVNLVLAGHVHAYQRSKPVYRGAVVPNSPGGAFAAPVFVVIGDGGNREQCVTLLLALPCAAVCCVRCAVYWPLQCLLYRLLFCKYTVYFSFSWLPRVHETLFHRRRLPFRYEQVSGYYTPQPAWNAYANDTRFGHGTLSVANATHLHWGWHINPDGEGWELRDEVWVVRSAEATVAGDDDAAPPLPPGDEDDGGGGGDDGDGWTEAWKGKLLVGALCLLCVATAACGAQRAGWLREGGCPDRLGNALDEVRHSLGTSTASGGGERGGGSLNSALLTDGEVGTDGF